MYQPELDPNLQHGPQPDTEVAQQLIFDPSDLDAVTSDAAIMAFNPWDELPTLQTRLPVGCVHPRVRSYAIQHFRSAVPLAPTVFDEACRTLRYKPKIDAFASSLHHQLPMYWTLDADDPDADAVDALKQSWYDLPLYVNPPWHLLGAVLRKIVTDRAKIMLILPYWPLAPWFPLYAMTLVTDIQLPPACFLTDAGHPRPPPPWTTLAAIVDGNLAYD